MRIDLNLISPNLRIVDNYPFDVIGTIASALIVAVIARAIRPNHHQIKIIDQLLSRCQRGRRICPVEHNPQRLGIGQHS